MNAGAAELFVTYGTTLERRHCFSKGFFILFLSSLSCREFLVVMELIGQRVFGDKIMVVSPHATIHEYSIFGVNKHGSKVVYITYMIEYT
jgi:hypothetical protein